MFDEKLYSYHNSGITCQFMVIESVVNDTMLIIIVSKTIISFSPSYKRTDEKMQQSGRKNNQ